VAIANVTIRNKSPEHAYQDIQVEFSFSGDSGTTLTTRTELFAVVVKPKGITRIKEHNVGFVPQQATRMGCSVTGTR
jgi:hypothetical protein